MLCEKIYTKIEDEIEVEYESEAYETWKSMWNKLRNLKPIMKQKLVESEDILWNKS